MQDLKKRALEYCMQFNHAGDGGEDCSNVQFG